MKIDAVFCDLDGTLLNENHKVSERNLQAIKNLEANGIAFHVATGRSLNSVIRIDDIPRSNWLICEDGGKIFCHQKKQVIRQDMIPDEIVSDVFDMVSMHDDFTWVIYYNDENIVKTKDNIYTKFGEDIEGFTFSKFDKNASTSMSPIKLACMSDNKRKLNSFSKYIESEYANKLNTIFFSEEGMAISSALSSKGSAVEQICNEKGYNIDNCIAFGDHFNDISMLEKVGYPVVMANAHNELKERFPKYSAGNHNESAIAEYLAQLL